MPSPPLLWKFQSLCFRREIRGRLGTVIAFANASRSSLEFPPLFNSVSRNSSPSRSPSVRISHLLPFSESLPKPSEFPDTPFEQGKLLFASEARAHVFATAIVHGEIWQSFTYPSYQIPIDNSKTGRSRQLLEWTRASAICGISKSWHLKLQAEFHVRATEAQSQSFAPAIDLWKRWEDQRDGSCEDQMQKSSFRSVNQSEFSEVLRCSWTRDFENAEEAERFKEGDHSSQERQPGFGIESQLQRLLRISASFYFFGARPCLQTVNELFQKTVHAVTWGHAAILPLGLMYNSSQPDENAEAKEKITDGSLNNKGLKLLPGACCLPHPEKEDTGGEDAYFICLDKQAIGVADGVGGWADLGVDAGQYARELMNQSLIAARQEPHGFIDPARVLERAHSKTTCEGSSTACILSLSDYVLRAANLGDSGFLVLRNGRVIFKSPAQQHNFNIPFQLGCGGSDPPSAAEVFTIEVAVGDVVVAGTDGLFDNLYDAELTSIVVHAIRSKLNPEITAHKIASLARSHAQDHNRQTPFSTAAQDAGFRFYGGKLDDITVVVSYITQNDLKHSEGFLTSVL